MYTFFLKKCAVFKISLIDFRISQTDFWISINPDFYEVPFYYKIIICDIT